MVYYNPHITGSLLSPYLKQPGALFFIAQVEVEKPRGHKLGIDVMLMTAGGRCGLLVGQAMGWLDQSKMDHKMVIFPKGKRKNANKHVR